MIETVVVVGMVAVLASVVFSSFARIRTAKLLDGTTTSVVGILNAARAQTLAGKASLPYGVHLQSDQAVLFQGVSYNPAAASNEAYSLDPQMEIALVALAGGGSDIVFNRLTGKTPHYGNFVIRRAAEPATVRTITIEPTGIISAQ